MKKLIIALIVLSLTFVNTGLVSLATDPENEITLKVIGETLKIEGFINTGSENDTVQILVLNTSVTLDDIDVKTGDLTNDISYIGNSTLDSSKAINTEIELNTKTGTGMHIAIINSKSLPEPIVTTFNFVQPQTIKNGLAAVNSAKTSADVELALKAHKEGLGIDLSEFEAENFSSKRAYVLENVKTATYVPEEYNTELLKFQTLFGEAMLKGLIELATDETGLDNYIGKYKIFTSYDFALYNETKTENMLGKSYNYLKGKTFTSFANAIKEVEVSCFMARFHACQTVNEMKIVFEKYNNKVLNIAVTPANLTKVLTEMADKTYADFSKLKADMETINNKPIPTPPVNGGGGGGGGRPPQNNSGGGMVYNPEPTVAPTPTPKPEDIFNDISSVPWASDAILKLYENGIIAKPVDQKYRPDEFLTREEFVKFMVEVLKLKPTETKSDFKDVERNAWYATYVDRAVENGFINGISKDSFGVGMNITREDIAVIINRACDKNNIPLKMKNFPKEFADKNDFSNYAQAAIEKVTCAGLLKGYEDNSFKPKNYATRAEAAVILNALYNVK